MRVSSKYKERSGETKRLLSRGSQTSRGASLVGGVECAMQLLPAERLQAGSDVTVPERLLEDRAVRLEVDRRAGDINRTEGPNNRATRKLSCGRARALRASDAKVHDVIAKLFASALIDLVVVTTADQEGCEHAHRSDHQSRIRQRTLVLQEENGNVLVRIW